jgi:FixJ family two-component response regulator
MATEPTVFVVDDDPGMRQSLRWLLESVSLNTETFATAEEFLAAYDPARPGCLLLDVRMPGMSGLHLQEELVARRANLPIIILTGFAEVSTAVRAMKMGAADFVEKPFSDDALLDRVLKAIEVDRRTRQGAAAREAAARRLALLTPRERAVMECVVVGKANKVISTELGIGEKTVEPHRSQMMKRLKIDTVAELIRLVLLATGDAGKP